MPRRSYEELPSVGRLGKRMATIHLFDSCPLFFTRHSSLDTLPRDAYKRKITARMAPRPRTETTPATIPAVDIGIFSYSILRIFI